MNYQDPRTVLSPRGRVSNLEVLEENSRYSIVLLSWDNEDAIGVRWNTTDGEEGSVGMPQSRGVPTWFILPKEIGEMYAKRYLEKKEKEENEVKNRITSYLKK